MSQPVPLSAIVERIEGLQIAGNNLIILSCDVMPSPEFLEELERDLQRQLQFRGLVVCLPIGVTIERLSERNARALHHHLQRLFEAKRREGDDGYRDGLEAAIDAIQTELGPAYPELTEHLTTAARARLR